MSSLLHSTVSTAGSSAKFQESVELVQLALGINFITSSGNVASFSLVPYQWFPMKTSLSCKIISEPPPPGLKKYMMAKINYEFNNTFG